MKKLETLIKIATSIAGKNIRLGLSSRKFGITPTNPGARYTLIKRNLKNTSNDAGITGEITTTENNFKRLNTDPVSIRNATSFEKNKGIGRKLYGRMAHELKTKEKRKFMTSDSEGSTSSDAQHLWESLKRRGYPITENKYTYPSNGKPGGKEHPVFGKAKYIMNLNKLKDGRV